MRICGVETEYAITTVARSGHRPSADEAARLLFAPYTDAGRSTNVFLPNGARLYLDVGAHPEYATAECTTLTEVLEQDRAGEEILASMAADATVAMHEQGVDADVVLLKNNLDSYGNSYGCHENYLVSRHVELGAVTDGLLSFLVTRQLICGAGTVVGSAQGARFLLSQRAGHMATAVSSATTRSRPMINTRDEPHADARRWRRLHVIVGDSTMAESSTWLKLGTMELALRVLEAGVGGIDERVPADAVAAIAAVARGRWGETPVPTRSGDAPTALALQRWWWQQASGLPDLDDDLEGVLTLWDRVLTALGEHDLDALAQDVDWAIKLRLLQGYAQRHGLDLDHPRVRALDNGYHQITGQGIARLLEARGDIRRRTDPMRVSAARTIPPATTRAHLRGAVIAAADEAGLAHESEWSGVVIPALEAKLSWPDPFITSDEAVDALLDRLRSC